MTAPVDKAAPWDGVPENPEKDGWHWLKDDVREQPVATIWNAELASWVSGAAYSPAGVVDLGFRYLGPCLTPSEVAALRAEAMAAGALAMREAAASLIQLQEGLAASMQDNAAQERARAYNASIAIVRDLPLPTDAQAVIERVREDAKAEEREAIAAMFDQLWPTPKWNEPDVAAAIRARGGKP